MFFFYMFGKFLSFITIYLLIIKLFRNKFAIVICKIVIVFPLSTVDIFGLSFTIEWNNCVQSQMFVKVKKRNFKNNFFNIYILFVLNCIHRSPISYFLYERTHK